MSYNVDLDLLPHEACKKSMQQVLREVVLGIKPHVALPKPCEDCVNEFDRQVFSQGYKPKEA